MQLRDKVIIIIDGRQGLGRVMDEYLADKNARLALVDLNRERFDGAVAACKAVGSDARAYVYNVVGKEQAIYMVAQVASDFDMINGLVNSVDILRDDLTIKVKDGQLSKMSLVQ